MKLNLKYITKYLPNIQDIFPDILENPEYLIGEGKHVQFSFPNDSQFLVEWEPGTALAPH